jgi:osmotically-inducible protein OsmY
MKGMVIMTRRLLRTRPLRAVITALPAFFLFFALSPAVGAREITDRDITWEVMEGLIEDQWVSSDLLDVETNAGIVTLTGPVNNLLEKERALEVASTVEGVRAVVDLVTVKPVKRTDAQIREHIEQALLDDPATDVYEVSVEVKDGIVTLGGTVDSWLKKELSERRAKGVGGVMEVRNRITVKYKAKRADREIAEEIKARLLWDVWLDDALINVDVENGKVTLSGSVGSAVEVERAYADSWIAGVSSVSYRGLKVNRLLRDELRRVGEYPARSDSELKEALKDALLHDPRVSPSTPRIAVDDGMVTLSGAVGNLKAKKAAEEDAQNTVGAWKVRNHLQVHHVRELGDTEIARRVSEALSLDPYLAWHEVTVTVRNARVCLMGTVDAAFEKSRAEEVVSGIEGVLEIENSIEVSKGWRWEAKNNWGIQQDFLGSLWRDPFIGSDRADVTGMDPVAALSGTVHTWWEWSAASRCGERSGGGRHQVS